MVTKNLTPEQKKFRKEVSRLNSMANKRIKRLLDSDFKESPALKKWKKEGGEFFSIRGKTQQEARREFYRVREYLDSSTSSITGTKQTLKVMAENTGQQYESIKDLQESSKAFFELANKVDEYLRISARSSSAIGYQRIWEAINKYTQNNDIKLRAGNVDFMIEDIAKLSEGLLYSDTEQTDDFFNIDWKELK